MVVAVEVVVEGVWAVVVMLVGGMGVVGKVEEFTGTSLLTTLFVLVIGNRSDSFS